MAVPKIVIVGLGKKSELNAEKIMTVIAEVSG
jgi:hypothetical protein